MCIFLEVSIALIVNFFLAVFHVAKLQQFSMIVIDLPTVWF